MHRISKGFTIVELSVVIAVLAILFTIGIVSYSGFVERSNFSVIQTDMKSMKSGIEKYYAKNGSYPSTNGSWTSRTVDGDGVSKQPGFIPGIAGGDYFTGPLPDVTTGDKTNNSNNTYQYRSDGTNYKLIRVGSPLLSDFEKNALANGTADTSSNRATNRAWGYWTPDAAGW